MTKSIRRLLALALSLVLLCAALPAFAASKKPEPTAEELGYTPASQLLEADGKTIVFKDSVIAAAMEAEWGHLKNEDGSYPIKSLGKVDWLTLDGDPKGTGKDFPDMDLSELQFFTKLPYLDISSVNKVTSVKAVSKVKRLYGFLLWKVEDINLADLVEATPKVSWAGLYFCGKMDLSPLAGYQKKLYGITLAGENITDIGFLADMAKLQDVTLYNLAEDVDLSLLLEKTKLTSLSVNGKTATRPEVAQIIENNPKISSLDIDADEWIVTASLEDETEEQAEVAAAEESTGRENYISIPVESIAKLTRLNRLSLSGVEIKDLEFLSGAKRLSSLYLYDCIVEDASVLAKLPKLKELTMIRAQVEKLTTEAGFKALSRLDLYGCGEELLSILPQLPKLKELSLNDLSLKNVSFAEGFKTLAILDVYNCNDVTLPDATALKKLKKLNVWESGLTDVSFAAGRTLDLLWLNDNSITDIAPLAEAKAIKVLSVSGNEIKDYAPLADIKKLTLVQCSEGADVPEMSKTEVLYGEDGWYDYLY